MSETLKHKVARLEDVIWKLEKQLDEVGKLADKRLELLKEIENKNIFCPYCGKLLNEYWAEYTGQEIGHAADCELAEAIDGSKA